MSPSSISQPARPQRSRSATRHVRSSSSEPGRPQGREVRMTTDDTKVTEGAGRLFVMIGALLTGLFALAACERMVQPAFAAPAADATGVEFATAQTSSSEV